MLQQKFADLPGSIIWFESRYIYYSKSFEYSCSVGICWLWDNLPFVSRRWVIRISRTLLLVSRGSKVISKSRKRLIQVTAGGTKFESLPPLPHLRVAVICRALIWLSSSSGILCFASSGLFSFSSTLILAPSLCQINFNSSSHRVVLSLRPEWCAHPLLITKDSNSIWYNEMRKWKMRTLTGLAHI